MMRRKKKFSLSMKKQNSIDLMIRKEPKAGFFYTSLIYKSQKKEVKKLQTIHKE